MAQHGDLPGSVLDATIRGGRGLTAARLLSQIFHPVTNAVLGYLLIGWSLNRVGQSGTSWTIAAMALQLVPSLAIYGIRRKQGAYSDADVSVRQERNEMYVYGSVIMLVAITALILLGAPKLLIALAVGLFGLGLCCGLVNLIWKISMHSAAVGASATIALLQYRELGILLWICAIAVGWARIRTRNHTPLQVVAGLLLSAILIVVTFRLVAPA